jgi:hypothetical protein
LALPGRVGRRQDNATKYAAGRPNSEVNPVSADGTKFCSGKQVIAKILKLVYLKRAKIYFFSFLFVHNFNLTAYNPLVKIIGQEIKII